MFGHGHSGKTMLTEALMFNVGAATRIGRIEDGSTLSDFNKQEVERQMSISASVLRGNHKGHAINVIDVPGFADFFGEVVSSLRVVDLALLVVDGSTGHDIGHSRVFEMCRDTGLPAAFFISKLDREHTKWEEILHDLTEEFGSGVQPMQFPVNAGLGFDTIACALTMKAYKYATDGSGKVSEMPLEGADKEKAEEYRNKLMEAAAESDDELLEIFFDKGELDQAEFLRGIKLGIARGKFHPVLCGSGTANIGISRLLDFIVNQAPSPLNRPPEKATVTNTNEVKELTSDPEGPTAALVFKTVVEPHVGEMSFVRVFRGTIHHGDDLNNSRTGDTEKIGQFFYVCGKNRDNAEKLVAGDIGAMVKLKNTATGDTLCDRNQPVHFPVVDFPSPVLETAIKPKNKGDEDKISTSLQQLRHEDPSFSITHDAELSQLVLKGQGDLHLNNILLKMQERFSVEGEMMEPRIPYRETIRGQAEAEGKHKKQSGGRGQFGIVYIKLEPKPRGEGYEFVDAIVGGAIPGKFIPAVDKGIKEAMEGGVIAGYPVVDVRVTLYDGKFHEVDSSEIAFKIAARTGFKKAFKASKPLMLEPIYDVTAKIPEEFMGDVMGDLSGRRGKIQGMEGEGRYQVIKAKVPQKELYRYATALRSMTQGRGMAMQEFSHYEEVPPDIQEKIVAAYVEEKEEE